MTELRLASMHTLATAPFLLILMDAELPDY